REGSPIARCHRGRRRRSGRAPPFEKRDPCESTCSPYALRLLCSARTKPAAPARPRVALGLQCPGGGGSLMKSTAALGNHPIHPLLVPIPIGAFFLVLWGDVAQLLSDDP